MFLVALKTVVVLALRDVFDEEFKEDPSNRPFPRRVDKEYALTEEDWPFVLVQARPTLVRWEGVNPDLVTLVDPEDPAQGYTSVREGYFEANVDIEILTNHDEERDRIWDTVVAILLAGRRRDVTADFFERLEASNLIKITAQEGIVTPVGDTIAAGTPWDPEVLTYEAMVRFPVVGNFFMSEYDQRFLTLEEIVSLPTVQGQEPPLDASDGLGQWQETGIQG